MYLITWYCKLILEEKTQHS